MNSKIIKIAFLSLAGITFAYTLFCAFIMTFSISVTVYLLTATMLFLALYYIVTNPIDKESEEPNPFYIFIEVASSIFFGITILLLLFNILYPKVKLSNDKEYNYIIVFGAGISNGKNEIMNSRIDNAVAFADKYIRSKFVLTGAKGTNEPMEEAFYMKAYMAGKGVSDKRIITETYSINTNQNIVNSLELIKDDAMRRNARDHIITRPFRNEKGKFDVDFLNIGFMSSDFHMTRIIMMAKKEGIAIPYAIPCKTNFLYAPYMYLRENLSIFKSIILNQLKL